MLAETGTEVSISVTFRVCPDTGGTKASAGGVEMIHYTLQSSLTDIIEIFYVIRVKR